MDVGFRNALAVLLVATAAFNCKNAGPTVDERRLAKFLEVAEGGEVDPRQFADFFRHQQNHFYSSNVKQLNPSLYLDLKSETPEGMLAVAFCRWEDWTNAKYFLDIAMKEKRDATAFQALITMASATDNPDLLKAISVDEERAIRKPFDIKFLIAKGKLLQALERLESLTPSGRLQRKDFLLWSAYCVQTAEVLKKMKDPKQLNDKLEIILKGYAGPGVGVDAWIQNAEKNQFNDLQGVAIKDMVLICLDAYSLDRDCQMLEEAEHWRSRGEKLLGVLIKMHPENLWYKNFLLPKFKK